MLAGRFGEQLLGPGAETGKPGEAKIVILSRPRNAAAPSAMPSAMPGFSAGGTSGPQERIIMRVACISSATSMPAIAAGTRPNGDSTE